MIEADLLFSGIVSGGGVWKGELTGILLLSYLNKLAIIVIVSASERFERLRTPTTYMPDCPIIYSVYSRLISVFRLSRGPCNRHISAGLL